MSTFTTLTAFRRKSFNCKTAVKILIHIKYVKNANHLGIVCNSERTRLQSGLQLILNVKI